MYFRQFYLGCLAHASYLIGSNGEAAVVDPQRDVDQYIEEARKQGLRIRYVLETHLHADFVSGHRELAARTGAQIVFGARADATFEHLGVHDGDELILGDLVLRALETPGHTPESISWLVIDTTVSEKPEKVLTGDTLFIGDVGRPDLVGSKGFTPQQMAGLLYDSLHRKLLTLDDRVEVFPAHGAGSACGRNMSNERSSTIGEQRRLNYALRPMSRDQFIEMMTTELPAAPRYFSMDAEINRRGAGMMRDLKASPLTPAEVEKRTRAGTLLLDVRDCGAFGNAHLPRSVNIDLRGQFASWAGTLLTAEDRLIIVADGEDEAHEAVMRLARVGLENAVGYLEGGISAWDRAGLPLQRLAQISVDELKAAVRDENLHVLDVRGPAEYVGGHVPSSVNIPLDELPERIDGLDRTQPTAVVCGSGYRSSTAASLLQRGGFRDLYNVTGGTAAWVRSGFETASS